MLARKYAPTGPDAKRYARARRAAAASTKERAPLPVLFPLRPFSSPSFSRSFSRARAEEAHAAPRSSRVRPSRAAANKRYAGLVDYARFRAAFGVDGARGALAAAAVSDHAADARVGLKVGGAGGATDRKGLRVTEHVYDDLPASLQGKRWDLEKLVRKIQQKARAVVPPAAAAVFRRRRRRSPPPPSFPAPPSDRTPLGDARRV